MTREDRQLAREAAAALASGEFSLHYQPKYDLRSRMVDSVEALARWRHRERGDVPPSVFIPLIEAGRHSRRFAEWTVARAVADQAELARNGRHLAVSVNLSGDVIGEEGFADSVLKLADRRQSEISLEITETAVIRNPKVALANLDRLVEAGLKVSIDDYGVGLSSLLYLRKLPAKELKIDRSFISGMTESHRDPLLVRSTIDLAHGLGMTVTAEGVEKLATLELLRVMGCDHAQGFIIDRPMPLARLAAALDEPDRLERLRLGSPFLTAAAA